MTAERFYITTQSYRHEYETGRDIPTQYGYLIETDFGGTQRLLKIPTPTESPNGERIKTGLRGICIWQGRVYTASWNTIYVIDPHKLEVVDSFSHPLMSDLHGLHADTDGLWATSSLIDSVLHFDWQHNFLRALSFSNTRLYPSRYRQPIDLTADYRQRGKVKEGFVSFHANHVARLDDAHVLVTGRGDGQAAGRVLKVDRQTLKFGLWIKGIHGPHDGLFLRNGDFALTETNGATVAMYRPRRWGRPRLLRRLALPEAGEAFWTRGLAEDSAGDLVVGRSVWKGSQRNASVVRLSPAGETVTVHDLELPDYPECRIFQIHPVAE